MSGQWVVVVPVKDAREGKTRLGAALDARERVALVRAMALDTVAAAAACTLVARVVVVTADEVVAAEAATLPGVVVVGEPPHAGQRSGLDAAALAGASAARASGPAPVAVLLGDVPALQPADLAAALAAAGAHERAVVTDAVGSGTTLLAVGPTTPLDPRFGLGSAHAHQHLGHVALDLPASSTLRQDVDVPDDLVTIARMPLGPRTAALVGDLADERGWPGGGDRRAS
ncbi:2-phospho-L-lactate guanylyltransferase [Cellulomonas soli]|uniref:Phosphoenolpyruvate guanylyltransferase n=1 Tax=Cellulomonas soli TaxID=931535 RepID=A0A512PB88_9CELL|nr:2-phospho-L-lactate guanylyltransferase [Cellulomonas soli]NYI57262.1 2-phospho-L-lactate guanylyltransferase [Cellulomonas soli]GEP68458.1 2-phospho-L-lactate guanylyltransferase [Cellulomonas soli]